MSGFIKSLGNFPVVATDSQRIGEVVLLNTNVAPLGFISAQGSTIGKLGSGATYAADDYNELYIKLWSLAGLSVSDSTQPYYLSGGAKGASANADWTAGKRIKIDESGLFARVSGGSAGTVGSKQTDDFKSHTHPVTPVNAGMSGSSGGLAGTAANTAATTTVRSVDNTGGVETRPVNVAKYAFIRYSKSTTVLSEGPEGLQGPVGPQGIQGIPGPVDSTNAILTTPTINGGIINDPAVLEVKQDTKANLVTYATTASDGQLAYATDTKEFLTISQTKTAPFGNIQPEWQYDISSYLTGTPAITSVIRAVATIKKMGGGQYRVEYNISYNVASEIRNSGSMIISGLIFKNVANFLQPGSASNNGTSNGVITFVTPGAGAVTQVHENATTNRYAFSGVAELESKPTWATMTN